MIIKKTTNHLSLYYNNILFCFLFHAFVKIKCRNTIMCTYYHHTIHVPSLINVIQLFPLSKKHTISIRLNAHCTKYTFYLIQLISNSYLNLELETIFKLYIFLFRILLKMSIEHRE